MDLPKEGQDAIGTVDWLKITEGIGKEFSLSEEEVEDFQLETLLVLVGVTDPEFYAVNIENHVGTTTDTAGKIATEGFAKIFSPIRKTLEDNIKKNLQQKKVTPEQNLNFILSGGDYAAFVEDRRENSPLEEYPSGGGGRISIHPGASATPQEGNKRRITDIKSKFTI